MVLSLITGFGVASAARETATNVFVGTATTGAPKNRQSFPVMFTGETLTAPDGTVGLRYFYRAAGKATGSVPGEFEYLDGIRLYLLPFRR